ncbi:MAG: hypothetical protein ACYDG2_20895 [Ruminiclostridium sp.]
MYGDDKLLYTSPEVKAGTLPVDFNVNVSGVQKLQFELYNVNESFSTIKRSIVNTSLD